MEIKTNITTGSVIVGCFCCENEHHTVGEVTLDVNEAGEQVYKNDTCKICGEEMECKDVKSVEFSYQK